MSERVVVVVPAFQEERLIGRTLATIPRWVERVVVVDDGSRDRTAERAEALGDPRVEVLRHESNRGVGAAIASGYRRAFACGAEICVVMAADGQMDPLDLRRLLSPLLEGRADYVKGDRLSFPGARARMPLLRWLGNRVLSWLTSLVLGVRVRDSQCGYTALHRRAAERLPLAQLWRGYGYPNDLLAMVVQRRLRLSEVRVRPIYADEDSGIGWRHALVVVPFVLLRAWARRLAPRLLAAAAPEPALEPPSREQHEAS